MMRQHKLAKQSGEVQYRKKAFGLRKELLPKAHINHSSSRTGLTISSKLTFTPSFHQLPAGRSSSTFTVCDGVSGWQTISGQWPWQTAACALLSAHSSIISSSQLVPLSFYSCCPGICRNTQYCAGAPGLLRPEVGSRVFSQFVCQVQLYSHLQLSLQSEGSVQRDYFAFDVPIST